MFGIFDHLFDMNHDGKLDALEKATEYTAFAYILDNSGYDDDQDIFGEAGLDYEDLEMMDPEERDGILEEAGIPGSTENQRHHRAVIRRAIWGK